MIATYQLGEEHLTAAELAVRAGISTSLMWHRLRTMSPAEAVARPKKFAPKTKIPLGEERLSIKDLAKRAGISPSAMSGRLRRMTPAEAIRKPKRRHRELESGSIHHRLKVRRKTCVRAGNTFYEVECLCPKHTVFETMGAFISDGKAKSCGCLRGEANRRNAAATASRHLVGGAMRTLTEIARMYGITRATLTSRMRRLGMTAGQAVAHLIPPLVISQLTIQDLTPEVEAQLIRRAQGGDREAANALVRIHDPLLRKIAKRWCKNGPGAELDDLMQELRAWLAHSIEKVDPVKGSLMAYASRMLEIRARRTVEDFARTIRVPVHIQQAARTAAKKGASTPEQIAKVSRVGSVAATEAAAFQRYKGRAVSLDRPIFDGEPATWLDALADNAQSPEDAAAANERKAKLEASVRAAMATLSDRERAVITRRLLTKNDPETFQAIADDLGVVRERIRQIETEALFKLKKRLCRAVRELEAA